MDFSFNAGSFGVKTAHRGDGDAAGSAYRSLVSAQPAVQAARLGDLGGAEPRGAPRTRWRWGLHAGAKERGELCTRDRIPPDVTKRSRSDVTVQVPDEVTCERLGGSTRRGAAKSRRSRAPGWSFFAANCDITARWHHAGGSEWTGIMAAAPPTATPRRRAGRTGAPRCEWGTAPAAASPNTLGHRARKARAVAPAAQDAGGGQESAHGRYLGDTRGRRTGRETDHRPCPPPRPDPRVACHDQLPETASRGQR